MDWTWHHQNCQFMRGSDLQFNYNQACTKHGLASLGQSKKQWHSLFVKKCLLEYNRNQRSFAADAVLVSWFCIETSIGDVSINQLVAYLVMSYTVCFMYLENWAFSSAMLGIQIWRRQISHPLLAEVGHLIVSSVSSWMILPIFNSEITQNLWNWVHVVILGCLEVICRGLSGKFVGVGAQKPWQHR